MDKVKVPVLNLDGMTPDGSPSPQRADLDAVLSEKDNREYDIESRDLSEKSRAASKRVTNMGLPSFPKIEGGRDFDEEVEERIRLT